jgi:hypothetical protein
MTTTALTPDLLLPAPPPCIHLAAVAAPGPENLNPDRSRSPSGHQGAARSRVGDRIGLRLGNIFRIYHVRLLSNWTFVRWRCDFMRNEWQRCCVMQHCCTAGRIDLTS